MLAQDDACTFRDSRRSVVVAHLSCEVDVGLAAGDHRPSRSSAQRHTTNQFFAAASFRIPNPNVRELEEGFDSLDKLVQGNGSRESYNASLAERCFGRWCEGNGLEVVWCNKLHNRASGCLKSLVLASCLHNVDPRISSSLDEHTVTTGRGEGSHDVVHTTCLHLHAHLESRGTFLRLYDRHDATGVISTHTRGKPVVDTTGDGIPRCVWRVHRHLRFNRLEQDPVLAGTRRQSLDRAEQGWMIRNNDVRSKRECFITHGLSEIVGEEGNADEFVLGLGGFNQKPNVVP
mmetsp:Transcript_20709/g.44873  ORF Transcript_20709/g.44873 Transcript_20709/m.44873 type:complete len:289 (+) Transcript_20709:189-1055(+)